MSIDSKSFSFVIIPLPFVYISVRVIQGALSVGHIAYPIADVSAAVYPSL